MEESEALKKLLISKEETTRKIQEMVSKAEKIFKIEKETGRIVFNDYSILTDLQKVGALLCEKYFAKQVGIKVADALGVTEIAKELHRPATALSGPLGELEKKRGWVEKDPHRKYKVVYYHIDDILDECINALSRKKPSKNP